MLTAAILVLVFAPLTAWMANSKGRSPIGWGIAGALFTVFAFIVVLILPKTNVPIEPSN